MALSPLLTESPISLGLVIISALVSYRAFSDTELRDKLIFAPNYMHRNPGEWYRFWSVGFVHGSGLHLILNMFALWEFGRMVEQSFKLFFGDFGGLLYLLLYFSALPMSGLYSYFKHQNNPNYLAVGASGAVSAVIFSFMLLAPTKKMMLIFLPVLMPAYVFGIAYLLYSAYGSRRGGDGIGHDAHFWGAVWGLAFFTLLKPSLWADFVTKIGF